MTLTADNVLPQVNALVDEYRSRCLWFWREDYHPATLTEELRTRTGREAAMADVWQFLTPQEVNARFVDLEPMLGRRQRFWRYILRTWHELGKL